MNKPGERREHLKGRMLIVGAVIAGTVLLSFVFRWLGLLQSA